MVPLARHNCLHEVYKLAFIANIRQRGGSNCPTSRRQVGQLLLLFFNEGNRFKNTFLQHLSEFNRQLKDRNVIKLNFYYMNQQG